MLIRTPASVEPDATAARRSPAARRSWLAVQVSTSLITIPLTVHYLGDERFGLWMTISSVLAMANFADFGIGNGLLNAVADAYGKDDYERIRRAVSSGFAVLFGVGIGLL